MAIFVAFAWMIEAAEYLGLIETEAQDPESRAYRLAHHGLAVFKRELIGSSIEVLGKHRLRVTSAAGVKATLEAENEAVFRRQDGQMQELLDLGSGGGVTFLRYGHGLEVKIRARTDDGGAYDLNLILPPPTVGRLPPP